MQFFHCPFCGSRPEFEFRYFRSAESVAPSAAEEEQARRRYERTNPRGQHLELWQHQSGCRAWLLIERDTLTHAVGAVTPARDIAPSP